MSMKRTLLALCCAAMMLPAAAQWTPGDNSMTKIAEQSNMEFNSPIMIRKADGSTIILYRTFGIQTNPETGQKTEDHQFYLYMQILDKDGNKKFDGNGILISYKPTDTASYGKPTVDTLSNGNIVITFADIREIDIDHYKEVETGGLGDHINVKACKAIAYCYDQEGNSVWSTDGVMLPYHVMDTAANVTFYAGPQVAVSGDNIYFASVILEQYTVRPDPHKLDSTVDVYAHYFEIARLDYDGNILIEKHDSVCQAFNYIIAAGPEGKCYFVYIDEDDHYKAELLGSNLENTWSEAKLVEPYGVVSREGKAAISSAPSDVIKIADGSIGLVYKAFMPNHFSQCYYNRIYPDGSVLDEHVLLSDTAGYDQHHTIKVQGDTLLLAECVHFERAEQGEYFFFLNSIKLDGTRLCPNYDGHLLDISRGVDLTPFCIAKADENYNVLAYEEDAYTGAYTMYSYTISPDGKLFQRKPTLHDVFTNDYVSFSDGQYEYLIFCRDPLGKKGLWIACIDGTDYTNSKELVGELPGKFSVSANKQVTFSKANLQYMPIRETYFFAAHQMYEQDEANRWISENDFDFMDLFGWGTGNNPIMISTNDVDYASFHDWGKNAILNSTLEPGIWRTMSKDEWDYLLNGRENAAQKRAVGQITMLGYAPVYGLFLLPDTFEMPSGLDIDLSAQEWDVNSYGPDTLQRFEEAGVVFLPAGGFRTGLNIHDIDLAGTERAEHGYYWTSVSYESYDAYMVYIDKVGPSIEERPRSNGMLVRLVKDAESGQGIEDIKVTDDNKTRKILMDGTLYIIRDGKVFNATGAQVR